MKKRRTNLKQVAISEDQMAFESPMIVAEIAEGCLFSGLFGRLDSARMKTVTNLFIDAINSTQAKYVIIDLSNVEIIDSFVAAHFASILKTLELLGVTTFICGINPIVAQTMVAGGVEIATENITRDLKSALSKFYSVTNMKLVQHN